MSVVLPVALSGCVTAPADAALDELRAMMTGSFSSAAQAADDEDYFDISLQMAPIWPDASEGYWLYVEQASARALDKPYRQRVYHLTKEGDSRYRSEVYELPDPQRFIGAWATPASFAALAPADLRLRSGCAVILTRTAGGFDGGTVGSACSSKLRGASYATSEVEIAADGITSWDRGFDAAGEQVWGAAKGPYVFVRQ